MPHPGPPRPLLWHRDNVVSQGLPASRFAVKQYNATLKLSVSPCIQLAPVPSTPVLQTGLASWKDMSGYHEFIPADQWIRTWVLCRNGVGTLSRRPAGLLLTESLQQWPVLLMPSRVVGTVWEGHRLSLVTGQVSEAWQWLDSKCLWEINWFSLSLSPSRSLSLCLSPALRPLQGGFLCGPTLCQALYRP